jgi:hypothetical protein
MLCVRFEGILTAQGTLVSSMTLHVPFIIGGFDSLRTRFTGCVCSTHQIVFLFLIVRIPILTLFILTLYETLGAVSEVVGNLQLLPFKTTGLCALISRFIKFHHHLGLFIGLILIKAIGPTGFFTIGAFCFPFSVRITLVQF